MLGCKCNLFLAAAALMLLLPAAQARIDRASVACSAYVDPCHCGLCPRVVDCSKQPTAECFCGTAKPGIYAHPTDGSRFWMCSFDTQSQIPYGVEVPCPARLVFDPVVKVCTVPSAVSPAPTQQQQSSAVASPPQANPAPKDTQATQGANKSSQQQATVFRPAGGAISEDTGPKKGPLAYRLSVRVTTGGRKTP